MSKLAILAVIAASVAGAAAAYIAASIFFPTLLFFPYQRSVGSTRVYSEAPIPDDMLSVISVSNRRLAKSEIFEPGALGGPIFLTDGGLRWDILSIGAPHSFGLTRPAGENVVINRSNAALDKVWNGSGSPITGVRSLTGVVTHERTHVLIRAHFGAFADRLYPAWVREGYCDYIAGSSTLSDSEATALRASGSTLPALFYYDSRKRVERILRENGGSVDKLFHSAGSAAGASGEE
jgi:hypothetical protein